MWSAQSKNGLWVWYNQGNWLQESVDGGLHYVLVKSGDGGRDFNNGQFNHNLVQRVHDAGLDCLAWTYCYLDNPEAEAQNVIDSVNKGADGIVLDIEYEAIGKFSQAETLVNTIRDALPDTFIGYSPDLRIAFGNRWPGGGFNPDSEPFPWETLNRLDGVFPQLYWPDFAQSPLTTLELANKWAKGCQDRGWSVPKIYPVLPCTASTREVEQFVTEAASQGFTGANIWRYDYSNYQGCIQALSSVNWPVESQKEPNMDNDLKTLRTYIGEIGNPNGGVVKALDAELAKKTPSKKEIKNIRDRIVELYKEATGN